MSDPATRAERPVMAERRVTYCRVCEAHCGMLAEVEGGRVLRLRPDPDNPMSRGYACPKGIAMSEIQNDPDRVLHPLRRTAAGGFERISWRRAISEIGARLRAVRSLHGDRSIGWYTGVPSSFSFGHSVWSAGFVEALGSPHYYLAGSQDANSRLVANCLLYGDGFLAPLPDLERTEFLLVLGANPLVSNASVLTAPRIRERLSAITKRGGRVVVLDPRRTETARAFEWCPVRPDTDAWLLASMLQVLFTEGLTDEPFLAQNTSGAAALRAACAQFPPETTAALTGVPADRVRTLARAFAAAGSAAAYGRTGACRGRFATLVNVLLDALNVVTGNLDRPGGVVFAESALPLAEVSRRGGISGYGRRHTRVGGLPEVLGGMPSTVLAKEITTPGPGQLRALFVSGGNPIATLPNTDELAGALEELDLLVVIDLYLNDTTRYADYVLPATTWLERGEGPLLHNYTWVAPFYQHADAAVEPYGEAREEWRIIDALSREIGIVPQASGPLRFLGRLGIRPGPERMVDLLLRAGRHGDRFGLRPGGLSLRRLRREHPHGVRFLPRHPTGVLAKRIRHPDRRVQLFGPPVGAEFERLRHATAATSAEFPLLLVSLRELRSHNSWTHNAPALMRNRRFALRVHPDDAAVAGVRDGDTAQLVSAGGRIDVPVRVSEEMTPGAVSLPWGWGHDGGWRVANAVGGANLNRLTSSRVEDTEALSASTWLNGVPVRLNPVAAVPRDERHATNLDGRGW